MFSLVQTGGFESASSGLLASCTTASFFWKNILVQRSHIISCQTQERRQLFRGRWLLRVSEHHQSAMLQRSKLKDQPETQRWLGSILQIQRLHPRGRSTSNHHVSGRWDVQVWELQPFPTTSKPPNFSWTCGHLELISSPSLPCVWMFHGRGIEAEQHMQLWGCNFKGKERAFHSLFSTLLLNAIRHPDCWWQGPHPRLAEQ